jgi:predicted secreted protein
MAKIAGKDVVTEISTDAGVTWKKFICEITNTVNKTRETTTSPLTKCDTASAAQEITLLGYSWTTDFEALVDTAPTTSQVTYQDINTLFVNGTSFQWRRQYDNTGSEFFESGSAYVTSLSSPAPVDGFVGFSGTLTGTGALDITA